jgi:predicted HNH restriction endonuclease
VAAELAKCVMLCANCHREVHAGMRVLDKGLLGLAEDALAYVA